MVTEKSGNRMPWKIMTFEAFFIVLSVFLGLWLHAWYDNRTHEASAERALQGAFQEAVENCNSILDVQDYFRAVVDGEMAPEGLRIGRLRSESWNVFVATESVLYVDYQIAETLAGIHEEQKFHQEYWAAYMQGLLGIVLSQPDFFERHGHPQSERAVMSDLLLSHNRLLGLYRQLIDLVGHQAADDDPDVKRCLSARDPRSQSTQ